jgi:AAA family ATP:ADP antiporter
LKKLILNVLNAEDQESKRVFLLLLMGFFMGFFVSGLSVGAEALFLNNFSEETDLPLAIVVSGAIGVLATYLFNYFQSKISFVQLAGYTLLVIFILLISVEIAYSYLPDVYPLYFITFTFVLPFTYLILLIFWGAFGRLFDLRQSKRIIGGIDTGQLTASILALLIIIPYLLNRPDFAEKDLITMSVISLGGMFLSFLWLMNSSKKYLIRAGKNELVSFKKVLTDKYMLLMVAFVLVSVVAVTFIDYSFFSVASAQFNESNLATFLAYFNGTIIIFSFLFQTFATDKIIALYGLKVSLLINPILIMIMVGAASLIGASLGFTPDDPNFIFFFVTIAVSKLFVTSLKDALDEPSFKLYFLPLDVESRFDIQVKIQGVVNAFAGMLAGVIIILLNNVEVFNLLTISIAVLPLLVIWYFVTRKMHKGYRTTLQGTLIRNKEKNKVDENENSISRLLQKQVNSKEEHKRLYSLKLMEKLEPEEFSTFKENFKGDISPKMKEYLGDGKSAFGIKSNLTLKKLAEKALKENESRDITPVSFEQLSSWARSLDPAKRLYTARIFRQHADAKNIFLLLDLLKDANIEVRMEAIETARLLKRHETWNVLIEMLDTEKYGHAASAALVSGGKEVLHHLESSFHKSGQTDKIKLAVVRIMGKIGGEEAEKLLLKKIDYPDKRIVYEMLNGFGYEDFNARGNQAQIIITLIEEEIGKAIWNMAALQELPKEEKYDILRQAFKEELSHNYEQIFLLLSLIYDTESVSLVKENVLSETAEGIAYGIELMDMFIDSELKTKLFPLVDDIGISEKIKALDHFFPREHFEPLRLLNNILNRDYNQISRWIKACALYNLAFQKDYEPNFAVIAHVFNNDRLLQEVAAWLLYHRKPNQFEKVIERVGQEDQEDLINTIAHNQLEDGLNDGYFLLVEIVMFLKQIEVFSKINGDQLCDLADNTRVIRMEQGETIDLTNPENNAIYVVAEGVLNLKTEFEADMQLIQKDVYGELFIPEKTLKAEKLVAEDNSVVFQLNINNFYTLMARSQEFTNQLFTAITQYYQSKV